ncbi:MAG: hypothetical protein ACYTBS_22160 [Planctomycetota bacterium]|jgi:hypothetical protein
MKFVAQVVVRGLVVPYPFTKTPPPEALINPETAELGRYFGHLDAHWQHTLSFKVRRLGPVNPPPKDKERWRMIPMSILKWMMG